ncbi:MAG: hypothetical protein WEC37_02385 [Anaerolineales bacterium]
MKRFSILKHTGIAVGTFLVLLIVFTFVPIRLLNPEQLSPWVYLTATGLSIVAFVRIKRAKGRIWLFVPILLLSILGFLEETSYGVESGAVQPIFSDTYHVEIYDVHNLIPLIEQILTHELQDLDWNFAMSAQFLRVDWLLLFALFLFVVANQWNYQKLKPKEVSKRTFNLMAFVSALISLLAATWLMFLPAEGGPIFGHSFGRLAILAGLLVVGGALPVFALIGGQASVEKLMANVTIWLSSRRARIAGVSFLLLILIAGLIYQTRAPLVTFSGRIAILDRLNPLIIWVTAMAAFILIALPAWSGRLQAFLSYLITGVRTFFTNNPAYIYALFCTFFVGFAQSMDQDWISLAQFIHFANPRGEGWNYWIEETLEMIGAFQLVLAAAFSLRTETKARRY